MTDDIDIADMTHEQLVDRTATLYPLLAYPVATFFDRLLDCHTDNHHLVMVKNCIRHGGVSWIATVKIGKAASGCAGAQTKLRALMIASCFAAKAQ